MKSILVLSLVFTLSCQSAFAQSKIGNGEQPQISVDLKGTIRLVFGDKDKIFYSTSGDNGVTFSKPVVIGEVAGMQLGMTRGPQIASSKDYSVVTAMTKDGDITSFRLNHKTGKWEKEGNVNDANASAPEGLMSIAADNNNNFYAVWLDLREDKKNNICFSSRKVTSAWSKNTFAYKSPEDHVCECCKPTVAVKGNDVVVMFRNWLMGSRDLYLIRSSNAGKTFSSAEKLGKGTWQLKACPMDGGGLVIDSNNTIHTVWQREGIIFYAQPGQQEKKLADGRGVEMSGKLIYWQKGTDLILQRSNGEQQKIADGKALKVYEFSDSSVLAVWEKDNQIYFKKV